MKGKTMRLRIALISAPLLLLASCASTAPVADDPAPTRDQDRTSDQRDSSPPSSAGAQDDPTTAPEDGGSGTTTVPAYFVGRTPQGPRLYREFRKVEGDPLTAAAALLTSGDAADDDYRTLFPGGAFESVEHSAGAGAFIVELADDGWQTRAAGMSRRDARLAVQQLVYTLQGVQQSRDPVVVQLGRTPTSLFGIDTAEGAGNADPLRTRALVNVTSPEQGEAVSGSFTASGVASSFEANVPWEIRQGDRVVASGFATAEGWLDRLHPWQTTVDVSQLAPGRYTFVAMTEDPSGGAEGPGATTDDKDITIG